MSGPTNVRSALDYGEQIAQLRDAVRKERERFKAQREAHKAKLSALEERIDNLCDLQLGRAGAQEEIPGAEAAGVLAAARRRDE